MVSLPLPNGNILWENQSTSMGMNPTSRQDTVTAAAAAAALTDLPVHRHPRQGHRQDSTPDAAADFAPATDDIDHATDRKLAADGEATVEQRNTHEDRHRPESEDVLSGLGPKTSTEEGIRPAERSATGTSLHEADVARNGTRMPRDSSIPAPRESGRVSDVSCCLGNDDGLDKELPSVAPAAGVAESWTPQAQDVSDGIAGGQSKQSFPEMKGAGGSELTTPNGMSTVDGGDGESMAASAGARGARDLSAGRESGLTPAASEGVVIKVMISGAHASFLHMRVFPSTTAGQVCRKIGEKLRQAKAEQSEHCLIAIYPRPYCSDGGGIGENAEGEDVSSDEERLGEYRRGRKEKMMSMSLHGGGGGGGGGGKWTAIEDRRRRRIANGNASIRHVLHTFRAEERLAEYRLGIHGPFPTNALSDKRHGDVQNTLSAERHSARRDFGICRESGGDSLEASNNGFPSASQRDDSGRYHTNGDSDDDFRDDGFFRGRTASASSAGTVGVSREGSAEGVQRSSSVLWKSRWIYRDRKAPALEADELQVEVSGSDTSEDEANAGWVDLSPLGQGHYCGYLLKKSSRDTNLWRRRWCILAGDKLWLLRSKSEQGGRRRRGSSHSYPISLVPCTVREVAREAVPSYCFELLTGTRNHVFRAESRAKQVVWVNTLQRQARQAGEDSFISLAEHMVCDEEFARCRRLNTTLSAGLGRRSCEALERAGYGGEFGRDHRFGQQFTTATPLSGTATAVESENKSVLNALDFRIGPPRSVHSTSGLFRRTPIRNTSGLASPVPICTAKGMPVSMEGKELATSSIGLSAGEVKRGLRVCMKVHRFREICRYGSCVAVWKRWALAADALEELCPGASDRNRWTSSSKAATLAGGTGASAVGESPARGSAHEGASASPRHPVVLSSNSSSDTAASLEAASSLDAVTLDTAIATTVDAGVTTQPTIADDLASSGPMSLSTDAGTAALTATLDSGKNVVQASPTVPVATPTSSPVSLPDAFSEAGTTVADGTRSPAENPVAQFVPVTSLPPAAASAVRQQQRSRHVARSTSTCPEPILPIIPQGVVDVALAIQDYRESVASTRTRGLGRGDNDDSGGGRGGMVGAGRNVEGGGAGAEEFRWSLGLTSQRSDMPPAAPPETLLDVLLDQVVECLGDA